MSALATLSKWLRKKQIQIEVTFAVYMFTPWEKFAFYSIVFLLFSLTFIAAILYLPHHVSTLAGRAWYYLNGENINVAASAAAAAVAASDDSARDALLAASSGRGFSGVVTKAHGGAGGAGAGGAPAVKPEL